MSEKFHYLIGQPVSDKPEDGIRLYALGGYRGFYGDKGSAEKLCRIISVSMQETYYVYKLTKLESEK